ncbi:hypothetical protein EYR40_005913 [Pleurotus pulmonarius]|nr:hypothetical protein EYR36_005704 [Pleurotus pulmonarius]KAF4602697.1 hypothetical protein EYR40_005913 [Pleurotus pulmonarius]
MIPNHLPSTLKPNTLHSSPSFGESSYEVGGDILPLHFTAATTFQGINSEHDPAFREPALSLPQWNQVIGVGTTLQHVESTYPAVSFDSTMNEDGNFPREFYPPPTYPTWMDAEPGQVTTNNGTVQDGEHATLWNKDMSNVKSDVPSSGINTLPVYPPWIAPELGQVTGWSHSMGMARTSMPFNGAMGPASHDHTGLPSFSGPSQDPQPVQDFLNAMVVRPVISTPAAAVEAERRRVHPSKFSCKFCPNEFTSKANRDRHHRAHLGIKPYRCGCGKDFTARADLLRHRKNKSCPPSPSAIFT